jgi:ribosome biogenesis GTPase / thiamine phosphate phosphatase
MTSSEDWDEYFVPTKREMRKERKIVSKSDRSKYKKTDQDKILDKELQQMRTPASEDLLKGRVLLIRSQDVHVSHNNQTYVCSLKGTLRQTHTKGKNLVIVGDIVDFSITSPGCGVIHKIQKRTSFLCRQDHLDRIKQQLIAANVDQLVIVVSVNEPAFTSALIDRYLIAARKGNMTPILVINKWDLCDQYPLHAKYAQECLDLYKALGLCTINISVRTGENIDALTSVLHNKVSVFSGPSGTGKSRLLNCLTGNNLTVGNIRAIRKGSHTTSCAQLLSLPCGGWSVDTPGIRSLGIFELTKEDLRDEFAEIFSQPCEFLSCSHTPKEKSCSVQQALEAGTISPYRYLSYLSLLESLKEPRKRR